MQKSPISGKSNWLLPLAMVCAAGTWLYTTRVLVPYQIADAAAHARPRGNLSDLYPRWLGARELLLHGRDPYGSEVSRKIQEGYYGHALAAAHPADPKDQQKFAYPLYVTFLLAPSLHQPFGVVRKEAIGVLLALTIVMTLLWLHLLRWPRRPLITLSIVIFVLGNLPVVQGLKLQQMTLFVAALVAFAVWLLVANRPIAAGVLLALATIKPQLVGILLLWLLLWTSADWGRRFRWLPSFLLTLAALSAFSEYYLPHWVPRFLDAVRDYRSYTDAVSIITKLVPAPWNVLPWFLFVSATAYAAWKTRQHSAESPEFVTTTAVVLAVTVIVIPSYALYNQVLLLPSVWLVRESRSIWRRGAFLGGLMLLSAALLVWPWVTAVALAAGSFLLPPTMVQRSWPLPFWSVVFLPVTVAALMLAAQFPQPFAAHEKPVTS